MSGTLDIVQRHCKSMRTNPPVVQVFAHGALIIATIYISGHEYGSGQGYDQYHAMEAAAREAAARLGIRA